MQYCFSVIECISREVVPKILDKVESVLGISSGELVHDSKALIYPNKSIGVFQLKSIYVLRHCEAEGRPRNHH